MVIVQKLFPLLPEGFVAVPNVHLGAAFEIDVSTYETELAGDVTGAGEVGGISGTATYAPPLPTLTLETDLPEQDEYEVHVYDERHGRRLVAAVDLISPSNKDRPESRRAFVAKVAALLQRNVCVSLVDIVTVRQFNLYADLLEFFGGSDPVVEREPSDSYAVTIRNRQSPRRRSRLEGWYSPLQLGTPLPTLPLWLDVDLCVSLELEASYEESCRYLRIA